MTMKEKRVYQVTVERESGLTQFVTETIQLTDAAVQMSIGVAVLKHCRPKFREWIRVVDVTQLEFVEYQNPRKMKTYNSIEEMEAAQ